MQYDRYTRNCGNKKVSPISLPEPLRNGETRELVIRALGEIIDSYFLKTKMDEENFLSGSGANIGDTFFEGLGTLGTPFKAPWRVGAPRSFDVV